MIGHYLVTKQTGKNGVLVNKVTELKLNIGQCSRALCVDTVRQVSLVNFGRKHDNRPDRKRSGGKIQT